jgi:hypothetical protein
MTRSNGGQNGNGNGKTTKQARRRVIAIGRRVEGGRWEVRTSLWRYLAATALSSQ